MSTSAASSRGHTARRRRLTARRVPLAFFAALALGACAVGPDFVRPSAPTGAGYLPDAGGPAVEGGGGAQRFVTGGALRADWWKEFGSPALDATVEEALKGSPSLAGANATLRASENQLRAGYGVFFPQVSASLDATRERLSPSRLGLSGPASVFNLFTLQGAVSYVADVFGGARRRVEASHAQVELERGTTLATYTTLTANVVNTSIARAGYRAEVEATRVSVEATTQRVDLTETQYAAGLAPYASVMNLKAQLAALKSTLPPLEQRADQASHLLAVLAGRTPSEWTPPDLRLADFCLPVELPLSLPSALVRQRPDILIAEAQLHEASAEVGASTANLLPTLTLSGELGNDSTTWRELRNPAGRFWSSGAELSVPVFQGGALWYSRKAAVEAYRAARAQYQQVVLTAFEQVADTLAALGHDAEAVRAAEEGRDAARTALALTDANYRVGTADYLSLMTATSQYQAAEIGYLGAVTQRLQDTVALYVALGGGWWNDRAGHVDDVAPPGTAR